MATSKCSVAEPKTLKEGLFSLCGFFYVWLVTAVKKAFEAIDENMLSRESEPKGLQSQESEPERN